jgi:hypothetical protein
MSRLLSLAVDVLMGVATFLPNPRGLVRASDLTGKEAFLLYNALSFGLWQFGPSALIDCHLVILWRSYGIDNHNRALTVLAKFLNEAGKWSEVGHLETSSGRRRRAAVVRFRNECGGDQGFHTHLLCSLPFEHRSAFAARSQAALRRLTGAEGDKTSIKFTYSRERTERGAVERHWHFYRYVVKNLDLEALWVGVDHKTGELLPDGPRLSANSCSATRIVLLVVRIKRLEPRRKS